MLKEQRHYSVEEIKEALSERQLKLVQENLNYGRRFSAIKIVRQALGLWFLKDAIDFVNTLPKGYRICVFVYGENKDKCVVVKTKEQETQAVARIASEGYSDIEVYFGLEGKGIS